MTVSDYQILGRSGEEIAVAFLSRARYKILERNYRTKCGEVDIIARDGKTLVFIEVKTRTNVSYGCPQLAVTQFKQKQISKAALVYVAANKLSDSPARFDVIAISLADDEKAEIDHIKNAFDLAY